MSNANANAKPQEKKSDQKSEEISVRSCVATIPRPILAKIYKWKVSRASIMKGEDLTTTSKIHTFKPAIEIPDAIAWLLKHKSIDGALIFENENSLMFVDGKFSQLIEL